MKERKRNYLWYCPCMAPHSVVMEAEGVFETGDHLQAYCEESRCSIDWIMLVEITGKEQAHEYELFRRPKGMAALQMAGTGVISFKRSRKQAIVQADPSVEKRGPASS